MDHEQSPVERSDDEVRRQGPVEVIGKLPSCHAAFDQLEIHGSSQLQDGQPYEQDYIVRFGLSERGDLTFMREYWDPTRFTG